MGEIDELIQFIEEDSTNQNLNTFRNDISNEDSKSEISIGISIGEKSIKSKASLFIV